MTFFALVIVKYMKQYLTLCTPLGVYNGLSKLGEFCKILSQFQTKHLTSLGISRILKHLEI